MMRKIKWLVIDPVYGPQIEVVANTRKNALIAAEAAWLDLHSDTIELVGTLDDMGEPITRPIMPTVS